MQWVRTRTSDIAVSVGIHVTEFCSEDMGDIKVLYLPGSCHIYLSIDDACDVKLLRINFQGTRVSSPFPKLAATWRPPPTGRRALVSSPHLVSWRAWEKKLMHVGAWSPAFLLQGLATAGGIRSGLCLRVVCFASSALVQGAWDWEWVYGILSALLWTRAGISFALPGLSFILQPGFEQQYSWPLGLRLCHSLLSVTLLIQDSSNCHWLDVLQSLVFTEYRASEHEAGIQAHRRTSPCELDILNSESWVWLPGSVTSLGLVSASLSWIMEWEQFFPYIPVMRIQWNIL